MKTCTVPGPTMQVSNAWHTHIQSEWAVFHRIACREIVTIGSSHRARETFTHMHKKQNTGTQLTPRTLCLLPVKTHANMNSILRKALLHLRLFLHSIEPLCENPRGQFTALNWIFITTHQLSGFRLYTQQLPLHSGIVGWEITNN